MSEVKNNSAITDLFTLTLVRPSFRKGFELTTDISVTVGCEGRGRETGEDEEEEEGEERREERESVRRA